MEPVTYRFENKISLRLLSLSPYMSDEEQEAIQIGIPAQKREDRLLGTLLAKRLIADVYHQHHALLIDPRAVKIVRLDSGQPSYRIADPSVELPTYSLSLSHSEHWVAAAVGLVSSIQVGVDVEEVRNFKSPVLKAFLTTAEQEWIATKFGADRSGSETLLWSLKEAYLKARGQGLRLHPQKIDTCYNSLSSSFHIHAHGALENKANRASVVGNHVESVVTIFPHAPVN